MPRSTTTTPFWHPQRFIRAVADVDEPHIRLLALMASERPLPGKLSGSVCHAGWSTGAIAARDPGFGDSLPALIWTLEAHGLIRAEASSTPWPTSREAYNVTQAASQLLERLAEGRPGPVDIAQFASALRPRPRARWRSGRAG